LATIITVEESLPLKPSFGWQATPFDCAELVPARPLVAVNQPLTINWAIIAGGEARVFT
jgi:hypothetical protein